MPDLTLEDIPFDVVNVDAPESTPSGKPKWTPKQITPRGKQPAASTDELRDFLISVHSGIAKLPKQEHWAITREEADSISRPLSRVMARNSSAGKFLAEHADTLLLCGAVFGVIGTRVITSVMGGTTTDDEPTGTISRAREHTGSARFRRLFRPDESRAGVPPVGIDANHSAGESNGTNGADATADALRDSLRNVPI